MATVKFIDHPRNNKFSSPNFLDQGLQGYDTGVDER